MAIPASTLCSENLGQRGPEGPGEAAILEGQWEVETFKDFTPASLMAEILECHQTAGWVGGCKIH